VQCCTKEQQQILIGGNPMFKKLMIGALAALLVVAAGASAITAQAAPAAESALPLTSAAITADDTAGLLYMYEEEKLARDVYNSLYALWGQPTFQNIARSEQTHMDAIKTLLVSYSIVVPETAVGAFNNAALQALYNKLMTTGSQSLADALKVGATIEEVDITDLQSYLAQTTAADIQAVYNNLMNGSYNHLRNFVNVLNRLAGEVYQPQYLSAELYQTIVNSSNGNEHGHGGSAGSTMTTQGTCTGTGTCTSTGITGTGKGHRGGR
jgi:hypothetical protein